MEGLWWVTAGSPASSLDESGLHSWKYFQISIFVLCRSAGQGSILYLTALFTELYNLESVTLRNFVNSGLLPGLLPVICEMYH